MLEASNIYLPLDAALPSCAGMAQAELAHALGIRYDDIKEWKFSKLSVDARHRGDVHFTASFIFEVADSDCKGLHLAKTLINLLQTLVYKRK